MLMIATPRNARDLDLDALQEVADSGRTLIAEPERTRIKDALLSADPGLVLADESDDHVIIRARGRSGMTVRLGTVWHEIELPDWHEGSASTWLADRFVSILRMFPRVSGGNILDAEEGIMLDPAGQAELVERYRYRVQPGPHANVLPILDIADDDAETFAELAEPVLRRRGASAADRAWFYAEAAQMGLDAQRPDDPVEVRYLPAVRLVQVVLHTDDGDQEPLPGRLADGVADDPPPIPDDLTDRDMDDVAIAYLAGLLRWT